MLLFSGGIFVTAAGILRCVLIITVSPTEPSSFVPAFSRCAARDQRFTSLAFLQDPINGAQKSGSWAVRETFVAVVTSNLPFISPLIARCFRPIIGTVRSLSTSTNRTPKLSRTGVGKARGFGLESKNLRRGMGPRSVNPLPDFSMNGSDEQICARQDDGGVNETYDIDLEADRTTHRRGGVIVKQTSVEVIETQDFDEERQEGGIGDYYLVKQAQRDSERLARKASVGRGKRSSTAFGVGIGRTA